MAPPQLKDPWSDGTPPVPEWMVRDEEEEKALNRVIQLAFDEPVTESDIAPTEKRPLWIPSSSREDLDEQPLSSFFLFRLHKIPSYLKGCPLAEACLKFPFLIHKYCLVNETEVSELLFRYKAALKYKSFRLPFRGVIPHEANFCPPPESLKEGSSLRSIYEIVEKMKPPDELPTDELARLLIKIADEKVDKKWVFDFALERVVDTSRDSGTGWNRTFEHLMQVILENVGGRVSSKIMHASLPLKELIDSNSGYRVSLEVLDLIYVAEIRRLAEGCRFISRFHMLWAFYELGYGLPDLNITQIVDLLLLERPPYDIYQMCVYLAECYADKVRLENLLFVSLHCTIIYQHRDLELVKLHLMQKYKRFLLDLRIFSSSARDPIDLRRFSSSGRDPDGPMFIIDFPGELEGGWLKFDG